MAWLENVPRGDLLPSEETSRFQGNWTFIEEKMQKDHFFDEDNDNDGRHKKVEMQNLTDAIGSGNVDANGDPSALSTNMTGYYYTRPKTATESPDAQISEPYFMSDSSGNNIINQLGIRAMVHFTVAGGSITQNGGNDWDYQHNIATVVRDSTGLYTITFVTNSMPSDNYIVLGSAQRASGAALNVAVSSGTKAANLTAALVQIAFSSSGSGSLRDPTSAMIAIVGG